MLIFPEKFPKSFFAHISLTPAFPLNAISSNKTSVSPVLSPSLMTKTANYPSF